MNRSLRQFCPGIALCSIALCSPSSIASAAPLTVVSVTAPDINCLFETDCTIVVTDTVGTLALPSATGTARLQSRTFVGNPAHRRTERPATNTAWT
jgi:hypothetical protein